MTDFTLRWSTRRRSVQHIAEYQWVRGGKQALIKGWLLPLARVGRGMDGIVHLLHKSCKGCNTFPRANSLDLSIGSSGHKEQRRAGAGGWSSRTQTCGSRRRKQPVRGGQSSRKDSYELFQNICKYILIVLFLVMLLNAVLILFQVTVNCTEMHELIGVLN